MKVLLLSFAFCFLQVSFAENFGPANLKNLHKPTADNNPVIVPVPVYTPVQQYPVHQYPQYPVQQYPQIQQYPIYQYVPAQQYPQHYPQHHHQMHRPHYSHYYPQFNHGFPC